MLIAYKALGCDVSLKIHFMHSNLDIFLTKSRSCQRWTGRATPSKHCHYGKRISRKIYGEYAGRLLQDAHSWFSWYYLQKESTTIRKRTRNLHSKQHLMSWEARGFTIKISEGSIGSRYFFTRPKKWPKTLFLWLLTPFHSKTRANSLLPCPDLYSTLKNLSKSVIIGQVPKFMSNSFITSSVLIWF